MQKRSCSLDLSVLVIEVLDLGFVLFGNISLYQFFNEVVFRFIAIPVPSGPIPDILKYPYR
jgi:hypothetical protein